MNVYLESSVTSLSFHTETLGIFHSIWPVDNHYFTQYDSTSFGIRKYTKLINQGRYSGKLDCYYDTTNSQLKYNDESVFVTDSVQNIFTLLARVSYQSAEYLDTKWYPMDHEGTPHRARFLLAGTEKLKKDDEDILCDHYRLDIEKTDGASVHVSPDDYFTDHVASNDALRQLWVEKTGKRRIIKASVSIYGMTVTAKIQDD